jgi:hypothetical protein
MAQGNAFAPASSSATDSSSDAARTSPRSSVSAVESLPFPVLSVLSTVTQLYLRSYTEELFRLLRVSGSSAVQPDAFVRSISSTACAETTAYIDIGRIQLKPHYGVRTRAASVDTAADLKSSILQCVCQQFIPFPQHEGAYYLSPTDSATGEHAVAPCFMLRDVAIVTIDANFHATEVCCEGNGGFIVGLIVRVIGGFIVRATGGFIVRATGGFIGGFIVRATGGFIGGFIARATGGFIGGFILKVFVENY